MFNRAKLFADELAGVCRDGEEVVELLAVQYHSGRERRSDDPRSWSIGIDGLDVDSWHHAIELMIGGLTLDLRQGRQAADLVAGLEKGSELLLTTQRLLVIDFIWSDRVPTVFWSTGFEDIASIRHSPRLPMELGRTRVDFTDGSMVRFWAGFFLPFAARRFAAAFRSMTTGRV